MKLSPASAMIGATEYLAFLKKGPAGLRDIKPERIDGFLRDFLCRDSVPARISKGDKVETVDLRRLVREASRTGDGTLRLVLEKNTGISVRPQDVLVRLFDLSTKDASLIPILKTKAAD